MQDLKLHRSVMGTFLLSYKPVTYLYINPILLSKQELKRLSWYDANLA